MVLEAVARVGGGALPLLELTGRVVAFGRAGGEADAPAARLRAGEPPLVPRACRRVVCWSTRTLAEDELDLAAAAMVRALRAE
jgi:L-seryl-tRNA(Ser) seleniumtransferase